MRELGGYKKNKILLWYLQCAGFAINVQLSLLSPVASSFLLVYLKSLYDEKIYYECNSYRACYAGGCCR